MGGSSADVAHRMHRHCIYGFFRSQAPIRGAEFRVCARPLNLNDPNGLHLHIIATFPDVLDYIVRTSGNVARKRVAKLVSGAIMGHMSHSPLGRRLEDAFDSKLSLHDSARPFMHTLKIFLLDLLL
jgi:hypothetical protein